VEHTLPFLEAAGCFHCDSFTVKKLHSRLALFTREGSQATLPHGLVTQIVEVTGGARHLRCVHLFLGFQPLAPRLSVWIRKPALRPLLI